MRDFAVKTLRAAAEQAGLDPARVMAVSAADNLTIPRPRVEYQFLPETWTRTGRTLAVTRRGRTQTRKKELYEVRLDVTANILADDTAWLAGFERAFAAAFPAGANDGLGNYVKIRIQEATFSQPPAKRVGESSISVFVKVSTLFSIAFTWRLTREKTENLIHSVTILPPEWEN